jgi:hypothetical protein
VIKIRTENINPLLKEYNKETIENSSSGQIRDIYDRRQEEESDTEEIHLANNSATELNYLL